MFSSNSSKLNFRLADVMRAGVGLAMIDGGFIIAVQIISFLLTYFGANIQFDTNGTGFVGISKATLLISLIGMLNLSVIIYRVAGLARGMKYSPTTCYQQALRRWPILILLYVLGSVLLLAATQPILYLLNGLSGAAAINYNKLLMFAMLVFIPYGILACIFVIDQEKNPLQAMVATFNIIKHKISIRLLLNISFLYALPFSISSMLTASILTPYLGLFNAVWFLFCHILIVVVYAGAHVEINAETNKEKPSKVIIA